MATLTDSSVDLAGVLLVVSTAMRVAVLRWQARPGVGANEIAYLRGGPRAVIATALAGLYVRGVVGAARPGMVKRLKTLPPDADSIQRAVYLALYRPNGPRGLSATPPVRQALAKLRDALADEDLIIGAWRWIALRVTLAAVPIVAVARLFTGRLDAATLTLLAAATSVAAGLWLLPRRTHTGARTLRMLRQNRPYSGLRQLRVSSTSTTTEVAMMVALYGAAALRMAIPQFAADGGLLDGGTLINDTLGDGPISPNSDTYKGL